MAVIALIPTGALEHAALGPALANLFPDDIFVVRPPERHLDGFTSRDVAPLVAATPGPVPTNLDELAAELVNSIFPGRRGQHIDFADVVEDLELWNQNQPDLVLRLFRDAVDAYIRRTWPQQAGPRFAKGARTIFSVRWSKHISLETRQLSNVRARSNRPKYPRASTSNSSAR